MAHGTLYRPDTRANNTVCRCSFGGLTTKTQRTQRKSEKIFVLFVSLWLIPHRRIMGWDDFWHYKPTKRRTAKRGIKAKSQRGKIGETWWSGRFISILESFDIGARLSRGRSYARSGQVMDLEIKKGLVTAKVQGSRPKPYKVEIEIGPLPDKDWKRVEEAMAEQAIFMAKLLAGEMPREIEEAFAACKLTLFPSSSRDMATECSCPD